VIDSQNPNTVYALGSFPLYLNGNLRGYTRGMFKTTDGGDSWKAIILPDSRPPGNPSAAPAFALDSENPGSIYASGGFPAALLKSADGGATWSMVNSRTFFSLTVGPQGSNTLYGANINGVVKSTDGGLSWTPAGSGSAGAGFNFLVIDPQYPSIGAYASGFDGLFKTSDGGANWTKLNSGLSTMSVRTLVIDPLKSSSLYVTDWSLLRSTDGGSNWSRVNTGYFYPSKITIDPQNTGTVYSAGFQQCDESPLPDAVFKSADGGSSWSAAMSGLPLYPQINTLIIDPTNTNTLYTGSDKGVFKSIDSAGSWNAANKGLPGTNIFALAVDPRSSTTVYAGGPGGAWKSTDGGASWNSANIPGNRSITVLALDPQNSRTVYAGGSGVIFKSTDAGTNWTVVGNGLPNNQNRINALVIDPQTPTTLYVGTNGVPYEPCSIPCGGFNDGVFKSTDGGETWTAVTTGLTTPHVSALAIDPQHPSRLYAGTQGGGVFAIALGPAPVVTDFRFDKTSVVAGGSYSATVSGSNLTAETFFDVQFSAPGSSTSDVALNWQIGPVASHGVPAAIAAGTWTITGVRAHELEAEHTDSFVPVSAAITVSH
jgi:photosystem II stability/assembly factor-like uncharacterized protein